MVEPPETIFEEREELMVSPFGGEPTLRVAHFLRPLVSVAEPLPKLSSSSPLVIPSSSDLKVSASRVHFRGWSRPQYEWKTWIESLHSKYQSQWKKAGIYEAIMGSKYLFCKHKELIFVLAEKWCPETNTFIFPWGEATITLEDVMVLGGYSALEDSVSWPLHTQKMVDIKNQLAEARRVGKPNNSDVATHYSWLIHFMGSGGELEHLAFLSLWLSKFVFPSKNYHIEKRVFSIAIRLAQGTRLALAPAVLSSIYGDLGLLKQKLMDSTKLLKGEDLFVISAPFHLVQLWAWERFPVLRPTPNPISNGEPRSARWHGLEYVNFDQNLRSAIECVGECFQWRPYAMAVENWLPPKFYQDKEQWVSVDSSLDKELESFVRCLRVSMLVGLDSIQQYLPHRVAMQFGMDQDLPACVSQKTQNIQLAWNNYNRSIGVAKFYIPHRLMESDVTTQYLQWWKQSMLAQKNSTRSFLRRAKVSAGLPLRDVGNKEDFNVSVPPGFPQKYHQVEVNKEDCDASVPPGFSLKYQKAEVNKEDCDVSVPPGFSQKYHRVKASFEGAENSVFGSLDKPYHEENRPDFYVESLSASYCQNISDLKSDDGVACEIELAKKPVAKMMQIKGSVAVQKNAMSVTIESEEGHLTKTKDSIKDNNRFSTIRMPGLELVTRISMLEEAVAELKAQKLGYKFEKKTAIEGSSNM